MKKLYCLLIAVCLIAALLPVQAFAAESGSCGENATWTLDGSTLTISGTGSTEDYEIGDVPWYSKRTAVKTIVVEEGITRLGAKIFAYTTNATRAELPSTLKEIGREAFMACYALARADLPEGLEVIGHGAFSSCKPLDGIVLPESLERLESYAFHFTGLTTITIPRSITTLEEHTFGSCKKLKEVNFHEGVDTIHDFCFSGCESLKTIDLPDGLDEISWGCFSISGLETITIPEGVEIIDSYAFDQCKNLDEIRIPNTVTVMEQYCLKDTDSLKTVDLPDGLKATGWGMFLHGGLERIELPEGLTKVTEYTFCDCDALTEVIIPDTVRYMEDYCFRDCDNLTTVELPEKLADLSWGMFQDSSIEYIDIPETVRQVEDYAFSNCDWLEEVIFPDGITTMGDYVFRDCDGLRSVHMPTSLTRIPWGCFWNSSIPELVIHEGVTEIGNQAFWDAYALEKLVVPKSVVRVGTSKVFDGADRLVIYCWRDSFIHKYAEENGIPYVLMDAPTEPVEPVNPFVDVTEEDFFYEPVLWAVDQGITTGTTEITFSPGDVCRRAHVVTFLWRAMGCPEAQNRVNPFADVKETDFYYDAVLWAVEQGITTGVSADSFAPYDVCNRAQVVTFLWRAMGKPEGTVANPFADVKPGDYFHDAVEWAVSEGITSGVDAVTFAPGRDCIRAQVVTFLYRALAE